jgi:hypothetical protein
MTTPRHLSVTLFAAALLLGGCATPEMKGTPFYSGEYEVNVPDADERRVNLWPLAYYRAPALSVAWPLFEHTEEHVAVRPFFSAYGSTNAYWEYNLLWPLCQADTQERDYRVFPCFWGQDRWGSADQHTQDYLVLFPFLWHNERETYSLFPLWLYHRNPGEEPATDRDLWLLWPLLRYHVTPDATEWHATLFGDYRYSKSSSRYSGYPWPLLFSWRDKKTHGLFTPLYAYESSDKPEVRDGWDALPLLLSWRRRQGDTQDLTAALGLYHRSRSGDDRSGWLLPLCAYDTRDQLLLTPLVGWDKPDRQDPDGYWYPFTPLAGIRTGAHRGGWLFPFFSHRADATNGTYRTRFLALGSAEHTIGAWKDHASESTQLGFFPLFSRSVYSSTRREPKAKTTTESVSYIARHLLVHWSEERRTTSRSPSPNADTPGDYHMTATDSGLFPLWGSETRAKTRLDGSTLSAADESSLLLALYDTKRNSVAANGSTPALDYERRRILWRVWHYERRNGDVSVDLFPFITHDTHADGFRKTSLLWRLYRHETASDGKTSLDILFVPVRRD